MEKELDEIKKLLSSLIISSPRGLTAKRLLQDYHSEIGKNIPFRNYGYNTFDSFLHALPDVCRLHGVGPNALVEPVVSEKVKHINEMIKRQKRPTKKRGVNTRPVGITLRAPKVDYSHIQLPKLMSHGGQTMGLPPPDYYLEQTHTNNWRKTKSRNYEYQLYNYNKNNLPSVSLSSFNTKPDSTNRNEPRNCASDASMQPNENTEILDPELNYDKEDEYYSELDFSDNSLDDLIYNSDDDGEILEVIEHHAGKKKGSFSEVCDEASGYNHGAVLAAETNGVTSQPNYISSRVTDQVKNNLSILVSEHETGIWCSKLLEFYNRRFGEKLDPYNYGFSSVSQMCEALSDLFYVIRPGQGDWKVFDKRLPKPNPTDIEEWVDYIKKFYRPPKNTVQVSPFPAEMSDYQVELPVKYPENIATPGTVIDTQEMPAELKLREYVNIIISEVYDPSKYWLQLKSEAEKLNILMDELQLFYNTNAQEYKMESIHARKDLFCAAVILGEFHRGIISKVYNDGTVKVFFIDYGTVSDVNIKRVYFLHEQFSYLPRQAIRARLSNIVPKEQNTMWSRNASKRFLQLVTDKQLVGYLTFVDYKVNILITGDKCITASIPLKLLKKSAGNYTLSFIVTDVTVDNVDIHINDTLIDEGYAIIGNKAELCATSRAVMPNIHLYPTFDEIEGGLCPTVGDLDKCEKLGIKYEQIFTDYFLPINKHVDYNATYYYPSDIDSINQSYNNMTLNDNTIEENNLNDTESAESQDSLEEMKAECSSETDAESLQTHLSPSTESNIRECSETSNTVITTNDIQLQETKAEYHIESEVLKLTSSSNPPPGFQGETTAQEQVSNMANIASLAHSLHCLQLYIINKGSTYPKDVLQMAYLQLNECYNVLKLMGTATDRKEISLLSSCYIDKFKIFQNFLPNQLAMQNSVETNSEQNTFQFQDFKSSNYISDTESNYSNLQDSPNSITSTNLNETTSLSSHLSDEGKVLDFAELGSQNKEATKPKIVNKKTKNEYVFDVVTDNFKIHLIKIDNEYYMSTQEVITTLLETTQLYSIWAKTCNINNLPSRVVNLKNFAEVYEQTKGYDIPGVQATNNLGCYIRVTLMKQVPRVIQLLGRKEIYEDIQFVVQSLY